MMILPRLVATCSLLLTASPSIDQTSTSRVTFEGQTVSAHKIERYPDGSVADFVVDAPTWIDLPRGNRVLASGWVSLYPDKSLSLVESAAPFTANWLSTGGRAVELNCDPRARTADLPARPRLIQFNPGGEYKAGCATIADLEFKTGERPIVVAGELSTFADFTLESASEVVRGEAFVAEQRLPIKPRTAIQLFQGGAINYLTPTAGTSWREKHDLYGELTFAQRALGYEVSFVFGNDGSLEVGPLASDTYFADLRLTIPADSRVYFADKPPRDVKAAAFTKIVRVNTPKFNFDAIRLRKEPTTKQVCYTVAVPLTATDPESHLEVELDPGSEICLNYAGDVSSLRP